MGDQPAWALLLYGIPMLFVWYGYARFLRHRSAQTLSELEQARRSGLAEPASLHPSIDTARCIGCGSCVDACPEKNVLGLLDGKAHLVQASHCIGHGACRSACPTQAITLVFGTAKRGIDIPNLSPQFETTVPGIFIAGELGGMGLIRNAMQQGRQAVEAIHRLPGIGGNQTPLDLLIVGAGPAGLAAALTAQHNAMKYLLIEQDRLGGTVAHYPRGKLVMTRTIELPLAGKIELTETSKEALLGLWRQWSRDHALAVHENERLEMIAPEREGFLIKTTQAEYRSRAVLLAIGRRGTPRKLDVSGEDLAKVVYQLTDPEQYRNQRVLVVGGGDSAIEAALAVSEAGACSVTLSYRGEAFSRAKPKNLSRVDDAVMQGRLRLALSTQVSVITARTVTLNGADGPKEIDNDAVIVCAGGVLPTAFLQKIGIEVQTKYGTA